MTQTSPAELITGITPRAISWVISLPLLTLITSRSWLGGSALAPGYTLTSIVYPAISSIALLIALSAGVHLFVTAKALTPRGFYGTAVLSAVVGLFAVAQDIFTLLNGAYLVSAVALCTPALAVLGTAGACLFAQHWRWTLFNTTTAALVAASLVFALGGWSLPSERQLKVSSKSVATPPPAPSPAPSSTLTPGPAPSKDPNASVLAPECPVVTEDSVQALRIPRGEPEAMVTSVLNTYTSWLNSGSERIQSPDWSAAPPQCTPQLAAAYGNVYADSVFANQDASAWFSYFQTQINRNAALLGTLRPASAANTTKTASYRLDQIIDTTENTSGTYLKFDATLVSTLPIDTAELNTQVRWYVQLIPWGDFYIIVYVDARAPVSGQSPTG